VSGRARTTAATRAATSHENFRARPAGFQSAEFIPLRRRVSSITTRFLWLQLTSLSSRALIAGLPGASFRIVSIASWQASFVTLDLQLSDPDIGRNESRVQLHSVR